MRARWAATGATIALVSALLMAIGTTSAGADSQITTNAPYTCTTNGFGNQTGSYSATVSDSVDPAQPGDSVTYRFVSPFDQAKPPVTATYRGGATSFHIPAGVSVTSVSTQTPPGDTTIQATAAVQGGNVVMTTTANQPIDGNSHPAPDLLVTGTVQPGAAGPGITWLVPFDMTAVVDTQVVGTVDADCTPDAPNTVIQTTAVPAGPQPPVPKNQSLAVRQGTSKAITLTATDADDPMSSLTFAIKTQPAHGTLGGTAPNVTYTPASSYTGPDSFTFTATDPGGLSGTGTVTINVFPANIVDNTPPLILVATPPASGGVYAPGQVVDALYACGDNQTGIKSCTGTVASGVPIDTSTVGVHRFTVDAFDNANNPAETSISYRVMDPTPTQQTYDAVKPASTSTANEIPTDCGETVRLSETDLPADVDAPAQIGTGRSFTFRVALGPWQVPALQTASNIVYTFDAPVNGTTTAVVLEPGTGSANTHGSSSVQLSSGKIVLTIGGPIAGGSTSATPFTPPTFDVTITATSTAGAVVQTQFAQFQEHLVTGVVASDKTCVGGDSKDSEVNPILTSTTVVDTTPPTAAVVKPGNGDVYLVGDSVAANYLCSDDHALASCTGTLANGAAVDTGSTGIKTFVAGATDAAGNYGERFVSYTVEPTTETFTARFQSSDQSTLATVAAYFKTTPDQLPRLGVALIQFLLALNPSANPQPVVPPPANNGPLAIPTTYPYAQVPAILDTAGKFGLDGDQLHYLGAELLVYFWAISPH